MAPPRRILIVDDSALVREVARTVLEAEPGWTVLPAESGEEALERLNGGGFDAVLLDVVMEGIDGPEKLRRLREIPGRAETPVVSSPAAPRCPSASTCARPASPA